MHPTKLLEVIPHREVSNPNAEPFDLGDDTPVSNKDKELSGQFVTTAEYGKYTVPPAISLNLIIEPVAGYNENAKAKKQREIARGTESQAIEFAVSSPPPLDAWYAEAGQRLIPALLQQPRVTEAINEVIIDSDDRVQIGDTTAYPWRCICALKITAADETNWIGTGWFAGSNTVITAGHCVYMASHGGWVSEIEVIPGCNGGERRFDSSISDSFRSVKGWTQKRSRAHDYGAIVLPSDEPLGEIVGSFGFMSLGDFELQEFMLNLAGYPGDKPRCTQWFHARPLDAITPRTLVYSIDTVGGQSGSPVWRLRNGERHVVGIHTNGDSAGNSATRINEAVYNNIAAWKSEKA